MWWKSFFWWQITWFGLFKNGIANNDFKCIVESGLKTVFYSKITDYNERELYYSAKCEDIEGYVVRYINTRTNETTLVKMKSWKECLDKFY